MSNNSSNNNTNNNNTRNVYNATAGRSNNGHNSIDNDEMEILLQQSERCPRQQASSDETTINIEHDMAPGTSQQHVQRQQYLQQLRRDMGTTRINMEVNLPNSTSAADNPNIDEGQRFRNIFSMLREARHQLNRSHSLREPQSMVATTNAENIAHPRTWRENLYDVLASPVTPRTDVLRALFTPSSATNIRYNSLPTHDMLPEEQFHFLLNRQGPSQTDTEIQSPFRGQNHASTSSSSALRLSRQSSRLTDENSSIAPQTPTAVDMAIESNDNGGDGGNRRQSNSPSSNNSGGGRQPQRQTSTAGSTAPTIDMIDDADTNAVGEMIVKLVTHFVRYLPFIFILFVKFIHDHLLGILDLLLLHGVVYQTNKSIKEQIAKLNQKSYAVIMRDMILVICVVSYRLILSTSSPDPFGLLINPPGATITLDMSSTQKIVPSNELPHDVLTSYLNPFTNSKQPSDEVPSPTKNSFNSTISVTKTISLGTLLYYVAVNDLILKLLTQLIKVIATMLPTKIIRHKSRVSLKNINKKELNLLLLTNYLS